MLRLSHENFANARSYIFAHGDDIMRAWFRYHFEDSGADAFLTALASHQFENGGFGGLFYEFDYQGPCLKSTEVAIAYILGMAEKPPASHPLIQGMMRYILAEYHPEIGNWGDPAVPEVNEGVHCYWVRYRGEAITPIDSEDERIRHYNANEKVCFAAFAALYAELVPADVYADIVKYPTEYILRYYDVHSPEYRRDIFDEGTPYDFEYFQWFVSCLPDKEMAVRLTGILRQNPTAFMELDYAKSDDDYVHLPCGWIDSPDNIVYPAVKAHVDASLEYRMKQQSADGRWPLGWSFGESEGMQRLQTFYETSLTLKMLVKLKRFERVK